MHMRYVLITILGLALGSFANVLIDRVPVGKSIRGRSFCDRCRRNLRWWELVPVVSASILRQRCPTCNGAIACRNTAVEIGCAAILLSVLWRYDGAVTTAGVVEALGLLALFVLAVIDIRHGVVPDQISIPAIAVVAIARVFRTPYSVFSVLSVVFAVLIGAGFFWLQRIISRGRWVGDGDTRVGALMGALFAPVHLLLALAVSYIIGGALAAALLLTRRAERGSHLPLVPFLWAGSFVAVLWGERIIAWYGFV